LSEFEVYQMNYWLFQILYDWYPQTWQRMIKMGIAAQHYPLPDWRGAKRNNNALRKLDKNDFIVASFKNHRFAGYGRLISHFYIGGPSLEIPHRLNGESIGFHERFDCEWTVIPAESGRPFINCSDLKKQGYDIDMMRGLCVKQIDEDSFNAIKLRLDTFGAKRVLSQIEMDLNEDIESLELEEGKRGYFEGDKKQHFVNYYERNREIVLKARRIHGLKCMLCGFDFEAVYGERGRGFIEVHHLRPISSFGEQAKVDPEKDMIVVCSNCHRMIHRKKDNILSPEDLMKFMHLNIN
jgi:hypothetical protein